MNSSSLARRVALAFVALIAALFLPSPAFAAPPSAKAVAVYAEGPDAAQVRADLLAAIGDRLRAIEPPVFADALAKEGHRGPMAGLLTQPKAREKLLVKIRKAAAAVSADAVIVARVKRVAGANSALVLFIDQIPGDLTVNEEVSLKGDAQAKREALARAVGPAITALVPPPPPPAPEPAPEPPPAPPARTPNEVGTAIVTAELAFEVAGRFLRFGTPASVNARNYSVFGVPMPAIAADVYPFAGTRIPVLRDLGLTAAYAHAFGIQSATSASKPIETSWDRFGAGLRFRLRTGGPTAPVLGLSGGFSWIRFAFANPPRDLAREVPGVSYQAARVGLDARIPFWRLCLLAHLDYLGALEGGAVYSRFRDPTLAGLDAGGGLAVVIGAGFEARLLVDYTHYFYGFSPKKGDAYVAPGAQDEFLGLHVGVGYAY